MFFYKVFLRSVSRVSGSLPPHTSFGVFALADNRVASFAKATFGTTIISLSTFYVSKTASTHLDRTSQAETHCVIR